MEALGPKTEAQLLEEGCLSPGAFLKLWPSVADPDAICSRSLHHVTLHFKSGKEQEGGCCV